MMPWEDPYNGVYPQQPQRVHKTTKGDILNFIQMQTQASEIVQVDYFESMLARHICNGGNKIQLLQKITYPIQTECGVVNAEYFLCNICRKCLIDRNSIEPVY